MLNNCKKEFFMAYIAQYTAASTLHVSHSKLFNKCLLYNLEYKYTFKKWFFKSSLVKKMVPYRTMNTQRIMIKDFFT